MKYFTTCISNTRCWVGAEQTMRGSTPARRDKPMRRRTMLMRSRCSWCHLCFYVTKAEFLWVWTSEARFKSRAACCVQAADMRRNTVSPQRTSGCLTEVPAAQSSVVEENQVKTCPSAYDRKTERGAEPPNCFIFDRFYTLVWSEDLSTVSCFHPVRAGFKDEQFADSREWRQATDITFMYK